MNEGDKLTPEALRTLARRELNPFWPGQAKQSLLWASDVLEAAEAAIREQRASHSAPATPPPESSPPAPAA